MMIHPKVYFENNIKGKSIAEIEKQITYCRNQIVKLIAKIEDPVQLIAISPSYETQMEFYSQCLELAKTELINVGGTYTPSRRELRIDYFNEDLDKLMMLDFTIGGVFEGYETTRCFVDKDHVYIQEFMQPESFDSKITRRLEHITSEQFLRELKMLNLGAWKKHYDISSYNITICDGTQWSLFIYLANKNNPIIIGGNNHYPYNFKNLTSLLRIE